MNSGSSDDMGAGANETNNVYLFHIIICILFILCFEYLFSWRKTGESISYIIHL